RSVIVAAGIVDKPAEAGRIESAAAHPIRHRNGVERRDVRMVAAGGHGDGEGPASLSVATGGQIGDFRAKVAHRLLIAVARIVEREETFPPGAVEKDPLARIAAKIL